MSKRKCDEDMVRFMWKRNVNYDLKLLEETELYNPFRFNNRKEIWIEIAKTLIDCDLKMKVTERSCRGRVTELLKRYCKSDVGKVLSPTVSKEQMTKVQALLERISKLEQTKPNKKLHKQSTQQQPPSTATSANKKLQNKGSDQVRAEIARALENVDLESSDDEKTDDLDDFDFEPDKGGVVRSDSKKERNVYLEKNSLKEIDLRKQEIRLREIEVQNKKKKLDIKQMKAEEEMRLREKEIENKRNEVDILRLKAEEEIRLREKEIENKKKELDIQQLKTEAEIEERKLLFKLLQAKQ